MTKKLSAALAEESLLYEALLGLCREKRDALTHLRSRELELALVKEEAVMSRIREAEVSRRRESMDLGATLGLPPDATLREIARASKSVELSGHRERLASLLRDLSRLNDLNRSLASQSLDHTHFFLRALAGLEDGGSYSRSGAGADLKVAKVNLFDSVA